MANSSNYEVITLENNDGDELKFKQIAKLDYRGKTYAMLQPDILPEGMKQNEVFVFRVYRLRGENFDRFKLESNDKISDAVIEKYNKTPSSKTGQLKKTSGASKIFGATKKVAKKTIWLVRFVISLILTFGGILFIIGGIATIQSSGIVIAIMLGVIGLVALVFGGRSAIRLWKRR